MGILSQSRAANVSPTVKVFYGDERLNPAPFVDWSVESVHRDDGNRIGTVNKITLDGSLFLPSGDFTEVWQQGHQEIRDMFANDYRELRILAGPGNLSLPEDAPIESGLYPRVISINVEPDFLVQRLDYTVELEAKSGVITAPVESFSDTWSFSEDSSSRTIEVTHNVSARGFNTAISGTNAHFNALDFVKTRLGFDKKPPNMPCYTQPNASGGETISIHPISTFRTEQIDEGNGSYQASETFRIASGVVEFYDQRSATFDETDDGIASVTINGTGTRIKTYKS